MKPEEEKIAALMEAEERMRIAIAGRIAAGMCANPSTYESPGWENNVAFKAVNVADKIITMVRQGSV